MSLEVEPEESCTFIKICEFVATSNRKKDSSRDGSKWQNDKHPLRKEKVRKLFQSDFSCFSDIPIDE
jgi:hypothetical protein